jgi:UDP-N-acetylglucosamine--N-acetylmuramyl-(pentapeptide) pyrophosphoryl-undecaprenol N-acetylglucosamine transferase
LTIVLTGGGSGGHITPILAVAAELKRRQPLARIIYIGQTGDNLGDIPAQDPHIDEVFTVRAGKFRRYHDEGFKQLLDLPTMFQNIRDALFVIIGIWQSWRLMKRLRPSIVFSRGGFVSVPVCLGAHWRGVAYMTHDSDRLPSLANRIIARWAVIHAVALPKELYPYPPTKTVTTGIPLAKEFVPVTPSLRKRYRQEIDLPNDAKLLFVIGGGLGSQRVNQAVGEAIPHLLRDYKDLQVVHSVGRANETAMRAVYATQLTETEQGRVRVVGFIPDVFRYSGAADLVITRAGATNLAEFAVQGKACIVVPSGFLSGGHQLQNAAYLAEQQAAVVLQEDDLVHDPNRLAKQVSELLADTDQRKTLGHNLAKFAQSGATETLAQLILEQAKR